MSLNLRENDDLLLPCKRCVTLCVPFRVCVGTAEIACPRCGRACDIVCERREDGWAIRVLVDGEVVAIWE
jgi:hypothetical protein